VTGSRADGSLLAAYKDLLLSLTAPQEGQEEGVLGEVEQEEEREEVREEGGEERREALRVERRGLRGGMSWVALSGRGGGGGGGGGMAGVDVCACCTNDQLPGCCGACVGRSKGPAPHDPASHVSMLLEERFSTLRRSACRCCHHVTSAPPHNARCCHWCDTMRALSSVH
jgi:hypothetical protein